MKINLSDSVVLMSRGTVYKNIVGLITTDFYPASFKISYLDKNIYLDPNAAAVCEFTMQVTPISFPRCSNLKNITLAELLVLDLVCFFSYFYFLVWLPHTIY